MNHCRILSGVEVLLCLIVLCADCFGYSGGNGNPNDPFQISTIDDWQELTNDPNNWDKSFILVNDTDFGGMELTPVGSGYEDENGNFIHMSFVGVFNGNGHIVRNIVINQPAGSHVGLFGDVDSGTICNLGIENISVTGQSFVGGLCGRNEGVITACYTTGTVQGGDWSGAIGGLCGFNSGDIRSCYSTCNVTGTDLSSGLGGLTGLNQWGMIQYCYSIGSIRGPEGSEYLIAGLCGDALAALIEFCFWDIQASGQSESQGGKGLTTAQMKAMSIYQNAGWADKGWTIQDGQDYPRLAWEKTAGIPIPAMEPVPLTGDGTESDPYQIRTAEDFALLSWHAAILDSHLVLMEDIDLSGIQLYPIGDLGPFKGVFEGGNHILRNAVILKPESDNVGLFGYVFGGQIQDLIIRDCHISGYSAVGALAGYIYNGTVNGCSSDGLVTGSEDGYGTGCLVGSAYFPTITACFSAGEVRGGLYVGGLIGRSNSDNVTHSYSVAKVTGGGVVGGFVGMNDGTRIESCYAEGEVSGGDTVGGLVGWNWWATISNCHSGGSVTGENYMGGLVGKQCNGTIQNSYSITLVKESEWEYGCVGGLIGCNGDWSCSWGGTIINSFWDIEASGQATSDGGEGKTTAEMKTISTFVSRRWDFVGETANGTADTWRMCADGVAYPRLAWEFARGGDFICPDGVDFEDLMVLAENWLTADPYGLVKGDATGDGKAGLEDLGVLSETWMVDPSEMIKSRVACWAMDDNAAGKAVVDSGGGNHHGTARRDTAAIATVGKVGGALGFDGIGDWIDCGTEAGLLPEAWSVCAWVKCNDTATPTLISFGGTWPAVKLQQNGKGKPLIYMGPSNYRYFDAAAWTTLMDGQWHHVAFVMPGDVTQAAMYLDGQAVEAGATVSSGPQAGKTQLLIGINATAGQQRFAGAIDDLMLFNRALTVAEIGRIISGPLTNLK